MGQYKSPGFTRPQAPVTGRRMPAQMRRGVPLGQPGGMPGAIQNPGMPGMPGLPGVGTPPPGQAPPVQQAPQSTGTEEMDALIQALAGQQAGEHSAQMKRLGMGMFGAPGNEPRNIAAGAFASAIGSKARKNQRQAEEEALTLEDTDKKEQIEKVRQAGKQIALANGATDAQATAYGDALALGIDPGDMGSSESDKLKQIRERETYLKSNPEVVKRIGLPAADKFRLTGNWNDGKGSSLTIGPDGTITYSENGQPVITAPTTSTTTALQKQAMDAERAQVTLGNLAQSAKTSYLTNFGRFKAWVGGKLDTAGMSETDLAEFAAERNTWANQVLADVLRYRKEITGVAGGPAEMARIESIKANPEMGPAAFAAAITAEIGKAQRDANLIRSTQGEEPIEFEEFKFEFGGDATTESDLMELYPEK